MEQPKGYRRIAWAMLTAGAIWGWGAVAAGAQDTSDLVVEVKVSGNDRMSTNAILANVKTRAGHTYDDAIVRADERRLLETGRFVSVSVEKTQTDRGVVVTFVVVERPAISNVVLKGNKKFDNAELTKELGFGAGGPLSRYAAESGRQAILKKYRSDGYYFASVSVDWKAYQDRRELVYTVVEGQQVKVRKVRFQGNHYFSGWKLRWDVSTERRFWPIVKGYLDTEKLQRDVTTIRNLYVADGFLDAEVGRQLEFSDDKKDVRITFVIDEGQRYRINDVVFQGNKVFSDEQLAGRMELHRGEFYTTLALRRDVKVLEGTYGELGYIHARVSAKKRFLDPQLPPPEWARHLGQPALLNLVITVEELDQYRVGQVIIRGNTITQSRVIRRELRIFPEQLYNTVAVELSEMRLLESRLFGQVSITPVGRAPGVRDALVEVTEGRTANIMFGVGVSSKDGVLGNISFSQRNFDIMGWPSAKRRFWRGEAFKGAGQTFRATLEPGVEMMRFSIDWWEPYLFDRPYSLGVRGFLFNRAREKHDETRYGPVVSVGHMFKNRWYGELSTRLEGIEVTNVASTAPPEVFQVQGTNMLLGVRGSLSRNRTDSRWMPSKGDSLRLAYEQVLGDFTFGKATADYHIYKTLYVDALDRKHILAGRATIGQIIGDAPIFERFYGGGLGSVRGFRYRGISPRSAGTMDQIGGDFMVFAGAEYTFPLIAEVLRGVVFLDTGTVEADTEITTYRVSSGFGIRWIIPFFGPVPMSLDFGWPLVKGNQDNTQVFSFTFGWTF
ncbi:MAG TPA: outer membrane protein assembly factor BamA [Phycisphaerae bacterium]|nr:outer membrane protein assembly factor BamA [Phycisphaerae bacterium]